MTNPPEPGPSSNPQSPPPGYPEYSPPQYSPPQYSQHPPPYPNPQYAQYPPVGYPPLEQGPPPRKRNLVWIWVAAAVAAAVVVVLVVVFLNRDKHPGEEKTAGRSLTAASTFSGYRRLSGFDTSTLRRQLGEQFRSVSATSADKVAKDATIAVYAKPGSDRPQFVLLAFPVDDVPRFRDQIKDQGLADTVKEFVGGVGSGLAGSSKPGSGNASQSFDPGSLGGALRCQQATTISATAAVCGWGDRSFFAMNLVVDASSLSTAADRTRTLRDASEH